MNAEKPTNDHMGTEIWEDWRDDPRVIALYLSVLHYGQMNHNGKSTPPALDLVLNTADKFYRWLS